MARRIERPALLIRKSTPPCVAVSQSIRPLQLASSAMSAD
jgi:hypothetical protein